MDGVVAVDVLRQKDQRAFFPGLTEWGIRPQIKEAR